MRRLLICTGSSSIEGGVERIMESLHRLLPARGFEVVFALARGSRFHDPAKFCQAFPGIRSVEMDGTSGTREGRLRALRRAIATVDPDIVLTVRLYDAYQVVSEMKAKRRRPLLATLVQAYAEEYIADIRDYASHVDLCVVAGRLTVAAMVKMAGMPWERVCSIPGGIESPKSPPQRNYSRVPLRLGYVGRLDQIQKRIRDLPVVLNCLEERGVPFEFHIVGSGTEAEWLRERIAQLQMLDRVVFRSWLSTTELYERVYPELDVFVHLADMEGAPIALTEALVHGVVPVVSEFTSCHTEGLFVHDHNALLFPVGNPRRAAENIERLHRDRHLLERLSQVAIQSRRKILSLEGMADEWVQELTKIICLGPAGNGVLPQISFPPNGCLERLGLPSRWAETLRWLFGRRARLADPGSEWPHTSGLAPASLLEEITTFAREEEARYCREHVAAS